jgi:DNA-binding Lrp family transcriptional regulator
VNPLTLRLGKDAAVAELHRNGSEREERIDGRDPAVRRVLAALTADARRDPARLAALTGLSERQVAELVDQLERQRVIRSYKTVVDWERLGNERVVAFIDVSVSPQRDVGFDQVAARIYRHPEVRSVHLVSGGHDLRIIVEAPTMREIAQFVSEKLAPIDHVTATNTHFLLKAYKEDGDILIEDAPADDRLPVTP